MTLAVALAAGAGPGESRKRSRESEQDDLLTLERVARYPPPGTRVPVNFRFSDDGRYLYFLASEGNGVVRSLIRQYVASAERLGVSLPPEDGPDSQVNT